MEENIKKLLDEQSKDIVREVGVLIERVQDDVKLIAEQQTSMQKDISDIKTNISDIKEQNLNLRIDHEQLVKRVEVLEQKFAS